MTAKSNHVGSTLDNFLHEEEILPQVTAAAIKRVLAWQVTEEMKRQGITKVDVTQVNGSPRIDVTIDPESGLTVAELPSRLIAQGFRIQSLQPDTTDLNNWPSKSKHYGGNSANLDQAQYSASSSVFVTNGIISA